MRGELNRLREDLRCVDWKITQAIKERQEIVEAIGLVKSVLDEPIVNRRIEKAKKSFYIKRLGVLGEKIYDLLHENSIRS